MREIIYPKISIVMPSFNQGKYLEAAILSVLEQEYPNIELVVIDGGSTDDSVSILEKYSDVISYWSSEPDDGQSDALNKGFKVITGDIVGWLNSDDTYQPGTFLQVAKVFSDSDVSIAMCSEFGFMNSKGTVVELWSNSFKTHTKLIRYWSANGMTVNQPGMTINQPSVFFRRQIVSQFDPVFDKSLHYAMDYDLWLRISLEHKIHVVEGYWANYRLHDSNKSGYGFEDFEPEWLLVSKRFWGHPGSVKWLANWLHRYLYPYIVRVHNGVLWRARRLASFFSAQGD